MKGDVEQGVKFLPSEYSRQPEPVVSRASIHQPQYFQAQVGGFNEAQRSLPRPTQNHHVKPIIKPTTEIITRPSNIVSKPTRKRHRLSDLAIRKHIHPECNTNADAIRISEQRDRFSWTEANHVFKISPTDIHFVEEASVS